MDKAILINTNDLICTGHFDSYDAAETVAAVVSYNYVIVDEPNDLEKLFSGPELVTLFNNHRPESKQEVSKFRDKQTAAQRTFEVIERLTFDEVQPARLVKSETGAVGIRNLPECDKPDPRWSVAKAFREAIVAGQDKETVLTAVRAAFPEKTIPARYYSWYKSDCKRKGLI